MTAPVVVPSTEEFQTYYSTLMEWLDIVDASYELF